jgi:peptidyl-prolyl cis-trans isomerase C
VPGIGTPNTRYAFHGLLVAHMTAQRVTRISWVDDNSAITDNSYCLTNQSLLRVVRMNFKKLAHFRAGSDPKTLLYAQAVQCLHICHLKPVLTSPCLNSTPDISMHVAKALILTAFISLLALGPGAQAQVADKALPEGVLASVNGRPIPELSVDNVTRQISASGQQSEPGRILDELINLEVLTQAAEKLDLDKTPEIAATLQLQYTQTMANAYLAAKGAEYVFSEDELRAEYERQSLEVDRSEYRASHILLETREDAQAVLADLAAGTDFETLAKQRSIDPAGDNGGDLGWFQGASMVPEFSSAVATMEKGAISTEPVQSDFGFHIIKLIDTRQAALPDFDSVKPGLTNLAMRKALARHVEELRNAADIITHSDPSR